MTVAELDIAAFLRARLDEREAVALAATPGPWESEGDDPTDDEVYTVHDGEHGDLVGNVVAFARGGDRQQPNTVHIADNDPAFVLADVAAKRRLIAGHGPGRVVDESDGRWASDPDSWDPPWTKCTGHEWASYPCELLRLLALPYAGHPDCQEGWKP